MARPSNREPAYDVVLYGATGFVGRQTVAYFARHARGVRWALGGRSADKLDAVKRACGAGAERAGIVVADAQDVQALEALAQNTKVVLSTAGPFAVFGSALVAACVKHGTHYVDITGETPWVRSLIEQHHQQAERDGTRIIPCCGFDSVPSDLGSWLVTQAVRHKYAEACASVKACFSLRGGFNGGTLASALNMLDSGQQRALADPFLLNPPGERPRLDAAHADPIAPHHDADFEAWLGPFFMGPVNTRVVRRSAALLGYGPGFHYQEYQRFGAGAAAALMAAGFSLGMGATQTAMLLSPVRKLVKSVAPQPGQGPSEHSMDNGSFRCDLIGHSLGGQVVRARVADQGDPGNRATTKFVCEAALALVHDLAELPGGPARGGVLTPASGLGDVLARRLRAAGMTVEVSS
ncbi:MAG TPA: saccharopine dehydrogenase NADP-binding domain-containing protein [Burkholderiaceae bacterium]|nr:saccharopine dehydrogenase NADP-binding domain-containing protein [Burkholderiaceae bacterium]